ncbi:EH signature domain-containing protein [Mangrovibacterium diazotrophicum]|nr:EH signature domain-containing protein [Mangrovibacterium diazotrophicum]
MKSFGGRIFEDSTKRSLDASKKELMELSDKTLGNGKIPTSKKMEEIYWKFQGFKHLPISECARRFTRREVRLLIWAFDYAPAATDNIILFSNDLDTVIPLVKSHWKDSFLITLWKLLARNWTQLITYPRNFKLLTELIAKSAYEYNGNRTDIEKIVLSTGYFENTQSVQHFIRDLFRKSIPIDKAHELVGQKEEILTYSYFSVLMRSYITRINGQTNSINKTVLESIYRFLLIHKNNDTTLITCASIINSTYSHQYQDLIKAETITLIGDPNSKHKWQSSGLSKFELDATERARKKINSWLNKVLIDVFFEKLVQDKRRKIYWTKYIEKIDDIIFCGNRYNYYYLKNIQRISKQVESRYKCTSRNQSTCAIIIFLREYVFVEFTDVGALYIYLKNTFETIFKQFNEIDDLKKWKPNHYACRNHPADPNYILTNKEGRITHQGNWENRIESWMNRYND